MNLMELMEFHKSLMELCGIQQLVLSNGLVGQHIELMEQSSVVGHHMRLMEQSSVVVHHMRLMVRMLGILHVLHVRMMFVCIEQLGWLG